MKYQVFDNDLPADCHHHKILESWSNSIFNSYLEAVDYCIQWLGLDPLCLTKEEFSVNIPVNTKYDYSGYGDILEIREINSENNPPDYSNDKQIKEVKGIVRRENEVA
jgi:hypothetical protein